jgi:hypothetical protein
MIIIQRMVDNGTYHGWRLCEDASGEKGNQIMIDVLEMESDGVAFWVYLQVNVEHVGLCKAISNYLHSNSGTEG